jgi:hypothetical protein
MRTSRLCSLWILGMLVLSMLAIGQTGFDDSAMRRNIGKRIENIHQVNVDWRRTSLLRLMGLEARLNAVSRIKRNHSMSFDWRHSNLLGLNSPAAILLGGSLESLLTIIRRAESGGVDEP